jgi:hypothetical protein
LAVSVAIVGILGSIWPPTLVGDVVTQIVLSGIGFAAFGLASGTTGTGWITRGVFWAWFAVLCGFWSLTLWNAVQRIVAPPPPAFL